MSRVRARGENIRQFIIKNVPKHPRDIARITAEKFDISRQAVGKHLSRLVEEGALVRDGHTRSIRYRLHPLAEWQHGYNLSGSLEEDTVWREDVAPVLGTMPDNVAEIWGYGFTEMFNNALDHSEGRHVVVHVRKNAIETEIAIHDDGVGIFNKIRTALGLLDERHAVLELAKGKLTTDPKRHTGEGIFFSSRMFDAFRILSGKTYFSHEFREEEDWILEEGGFSSGTSVWMKLNNHTSRTTKKVFDRFSSGEDYGFNKTVVPVRMAQYGDDLLVSRSQAKRLLARVDRFRTVIFDFDEVDSIGQAFADEVFRVFANEHPDVELTVLKANSRVKRMIARARALDQSER